MSEVIVVGGGAAGMYAAWTAASYGHSVTLMEQNEKLGKKLFITGKGRCNMTNAASMDEVFRNVVTNPKFLYSAFHGHSNLDFMDAMRDRGLAIKTERGDRVFPESAHSSDVIRTLEGALKESGVRVMLNTTVEDLVVKDGAATGVKYLQNGSHKKMSADSVIVATGGLSYASTGSTGDGLRFAKAQGLTVTRCRPALVPIETYEAEICQNLMGLSLKNVNLKIYYMAGRKQKVVYDAFGEMLFTHFGISGPLVLSASSYINVNFLDHEDLIVKETGEYPELLMEIDLKPALNEEQFMARINREFDAAMNKEIKNVIPAMYPAKLVPIILKRAGIDGNKKINVITREEKQTICNLTKHFPLTFKGFRGYNEAIITHGGINVSQINPSTMECRTIKGLYFVGEVLDVDALTGGFNLQIAWSSAYAAGSSIEWV